MTNAIELEKFSFQSVMNRIVSNLGPTGQTSLGLYQQMVDTLNDRAHGTTSGPHCDDQLVGGQPAINGFPIQCPRQEGVLSKTNPFEPGDDGFAPVALVNRFDLAPQNGSNCGQYRIVYGKNSGIENVLDRMLFIFEAVLPNPHPEAGIGGCRPVAEFWANLSTDGDANSRASKLANFYYSGLPGFAPVIEASHYGPGGTDTGQIRANMFMNRVSQQPWELREFRLGSVCGETSPCPLVAKNTFVQVNPFGGLFGPNGQSSGFQTEFLDQVEALASGDVNTITMSTSSGFNAGESIESGTSNDYRVQAENNTGLHQAITAKLKSIGRSDLTSNNILDRATTQSCAGCHQLSIGDDLGAGATWPRSNLFTHVSEKRVISPALAQVFLPFRAQVLSHFLDPTCAAPPSANVDSPVRRTLGGGVVGAAN
ncbi:hypothetical protein LVJ94_40370 [Pendulispora rubella]|uniref:Cytochrome c domain-containing protein n=1 Tax=Pendulispora rubella TaxID=2741070 RepID=A0ABZ2L1P1_9BACT